jgi:hypothetical protein
MSLHHQHNPHTRQPDEPAVAGGLDTKGHEPQDVVLQRARRGAAPAANGGQGQMTTPPVMLAQLAPQLAPAMNNRPGFYPEYIYGLHEQGGEGCMIEAGRPGWVLELAEVGLHGGQPTSFSNLAQQGLGVVVRLNHGYGSTGTLPTPDRYSQFAEACATYVARSQGCHVWIIGNEPNHEQERPDGQPITPGDYARAYKLCRSKIRSLPGREQDHVLVAGPAPWNIQTKYDGNPSGDWGKYFADTLALLGDGECDGFAIHTYTRLHDPGRIQVDIPFNSPGYSHLHDEFRTYRDFMERIPGRFRQLPVLITETDPTEPTRGWEPANNLGWVKTAYREIAEWNRNPNKQPIQALILYRWPVRADQPNWSISNRQGIIDDFKEALRADPAGDYQVRMAVASLSPDLPPERMVAPLPPIYTNQQLIDALASAANALGLGNWALLEKAGLNINQLAADREGLYTGAALEALPNLAAAERALIRAELIKQLSRRPRWKGIVNAQAGLMLRTGPGQNFAAVKGLPHETNVMVLSEQGPWLFVLADGDAGYVFAEFVIREPAIATTPTRITVSADMPLAPPASQQFALPPDADWDTKAVVNSWNRYGALVTTLAGQLGMDPAIAIAIIATESAGAGLGDDGRLIIRFEVHQFLAYCNDQTRPVAGQHFRFDGSKTYQDPLQQMWRRDPNGEWQPVHVGGQAGQWAVLDFARQIDPFAALMCISMGAPQVMGFNYELLGYRSAQAMFDDFQRSEHTQIASLFRFIEARGLVDAVRNREFRALAAAYNGEGQVDLYAGLIQKRLAIFEALRTTVAPAGQAALAPVPAALAEPSPVPAALPVPDVTRASSLRELDPDLYKAWSEHIKQGFANNNIMFNRVLEGFMRPYQTTIWMYRILFAIGVASFIASVVMAIVMRDKPAATAISATAIFGGLSIVAFLSYFVSRPLQALEENLQFITWLGIVYNTYWTRLVNTTDAATQHQELEDATNDAVNSIKEMLDKHAAHSRQRSGLTP